MKTLTLVKIQLLEKVLYHFKTCNINSSLFLKDFYFVNEISLSQIEFLYRSSISITSWGLTRLEGPECPWQRAARMK